jgi:hypothetical protein
MMPMISNSLKSRNSTLSRRTVFALAVLASTAWTPVAVAKDFPAVIKLASLDGSTGFRLDGSTFKDLSGYSVASGGDVNGDGFADLIIGGPSAGVGVQSYGGSSYVFGKASGFAPKLKLSSLDGSNGFRLDGVAADDRSGRSIASATDVNGDGFADLIIGAPGADPGGKSYAGSSYVVFGRSP